MLEAVCGLPHPIALASFRRTGRRWSVVGGAVLAVGLAAALPHHVVLPRCLSVRALGCSVATLLAVVALPIELSWRAFAFAIPDREQVCIRFAVCGPRVAAEVSEVHRNGSAWADLRLCRVLTRQHHVEPPAPRHLINQICADITIDLVQSMLAHCLLSQIPGH